MKRYLLPAVLALCTFISVYAIQVDIEELKKAEKIEFENYTGKNRKVESVPEIKAIGLRIASGLRSGRDNFHYHMKYSVIHAFGKEEDGKLGADIFSIDRDAKVDHIKNVRRVVASYLSAMYGYSDSEGSAIALFATYYNAYHRGDMDYFSTRYRSAVVSNLNVKNAGISTKYYEWPGYTMMLIPLKEGKGGTVELDRISEKDVREELRKDLTNIEDRKVLTELKEKEIREEKRAITKEKGELQKKGEELKREDKAVEKEKVVVAEKKKEIEKKREELKEEKKKVSEIKDEKEKKVAEEKIIQEELKVSEKENKVKEEEQAVADKEKKVEEKKAEIAKEGEKVTERETKVAEREKGVKEEKEEIRKDEIRREITRSPENVKKALQEEAKELDKREDALRSGKSDKAVFALKFYYLKIKDYIEGGHYNNELYMINASTRKIEFKSPVENICGSRYDIFSGGIVLITHNGSHKSGHQLALIDRENLTLKIKGDVNIFWRSFVEIRDNMIYAIIFDNDQYFLGVFDSGLKLVARSKEGISQDTFITFFEEYVYINSSEKKILVLNRKDLSLVDTIEAKM